MAGTAEKQKGHGIIPCIFVDINKVFKEPVAKGSDSVFVVGAVGVEPTTDRL